MISDYLVMMVQELREIKWGDSTEPGFKKELLMEGTLKLR